MNDRGQYRDDQVCVTIARHHMRFSPYGAALGGAVGGALLAEKRRVGGFVLGGLVGVAVSIVLGLSEPA